MSDDALTTAGTLSNVPIVPSSQTGVVFVHGGGIFKPNYWEPTAKKIQEFIDGNSVPTTFAASGACYSEVINSVEAQAARVMSHTSRETAFLNALLWDGIRAGIALTSPQVFLPQLAHSVFKALGSGWSDTPIDKLWEAVANAALAKSLQDVRNQITETVNDVVFYLRNDDKFVKPIRQTVIDKITAAAQQHDRIVLVSHSLGTVVTYDVLNAWAGNKPTISYWFTLGCPLTKVLQLRDGTPTRLTYDKVEQWYNVFDTTDMVASPLCAQFSKSGYHLLDIFVDVCKGLDPLKSHDYLNDDTTLRMIADAILETNRTKN